MLNVLKARPGLISFDLKCGQPLVQDALFYQISLIPSFLILLSFGITQTRRHLMLNVLKARPGLISPMDIAFKQRRLSYACAFGSTVHLLFQCIFHDFQAIDYEGSAALGTLMMLVAVLVFGVVHFPVFACLTVGSAHGYGLGALYIWMLTIVSIVRLLSCDVSALTRTFIFCRNAPYLACLIFLCVDIPGRFYTAIKDRRFFVHCPEGTLPHKNRDLEDIRSSNQGVHVTNLLRWRDPVEKPEESKRGRLWNFIQDYTYRPNPEFQYSTRLLSTLLTAFILLYAIAFHSFTVAGVFFMRIYKIIKQVPHREAAETLEIVLKSFAAFLLISIALSLVLGCYGIMRLFVTYRETMYRMYRGDLDHGMRRPNFADNLVGSMKYSGFQVIYIIWGFVIQASVFMMICFILALVAGTVFFGYHQWLVDALLKLWPIYLMTIVIQVIQRLVAKYCILQSPNSIHITNRRVFSLVTYFTFFYNIFLGLFSCVLRILKAVVIGTLFAPRLDQSLLPSHYDHFDPGYLAFVGFMKLEYSQTHPVMLVFLRLLMACAKEQRRLGSKDQSPLEDEDKGWATGQERAARWEEDHCEYLRKRRTAFKWQIFYTLISTPELRLLRKGYAPAYQKAKQSGFPMPKSDQLCIDMKNLPMQEIVDDVDANPLRRLSKSLHRAVECFSCTCAK